MLVDQAPRKFDSNLDGQSSAFTIAASSKAFQILSNQLYTDKPRAIIRELSTNALDSHIAAGKPDVPFDVQLPTTWESVLIVRDYGTGMSPEAIQQLYTTYFGSDKTHTNDLVGGLGLGSKSPFAYTDQFTAISWFGGRKYMYAAYISDANVPEIALVSEEESDEPTGFAVHVPVKDADIRAFTSTAKRVYEFFDVKPNLNQSISFLEYDEPLMTVYYNGIECSLYDDQEHTVVMQGPIGYPVDVHSLCDEVGYGVRNKVSAFLNKGWRIKAPVGTLEITASREALSYDKKTIKTLLDLADGVLKQVRQKAIDKLASITDIADASELILATQKYLPSDLSLAETNWNGLTWTRSQFMADLPPDTVCRKLTKKHWSRSKDPHDIAIFDDRIAVGGKYKTRIYWSDKQRPYKETVNANPAAEKEVILYFTGPTVGLKTWLKDIGLPEGEEMPKRPKKTTTAGGRTVNYGATEYSGFCLTSDHGLSATANTILDEPNAKVLVLSTEAENDSLGHVISERDAFKALGCWPDKLDEEIYVFKVNHHHTKVVKALQKHPGYITRKELLSLQTLTPPKISRKMAFVESLAGSVKGIRPYSELADVLDMSFVKNDEITQLVKRVKAIQEAANGQTGAHRMKRVLEPYGLAFDGPKYVQLVEHCIRKSTAELHGEYRKYKYAIKYVIDAYESCRHWNYASSKMRNLVTQWFNTETANQAVEVEKDDTQQHEVA